MDGSIVDEACCGACAHAVAVAQAGGAPPNLNAPLRFHIGEDGAPIGAELVIRQTGHPAVVYPILKAETVIGREPPADVVVDHGTLSRRQSSFRFTPSGEVLVVDLESTCGTFVNGEQVDYGGERRILQGDEVYVSEVILEIRPMLRG